MNNLRVPRHTKSSVWFTFFWYVISNQLNKMVCSKFEMLLNNFVVFSCSSLNMFKKIWPCTSCQIIIFTCHFEKAFLDFYFDWKVDFLVHAMTNTQNIFMNFYFVNKLLLTYKITIFDYMLHKCIYMKYFLINLLFCDIFFY